MALSLPFSDPRVRAIVRAAFPGASSRRPVRISASTRERVADYWDGGSRDYTAFVRLATLESLPSDAMPGYARQQTGNPFGLPIGEVALAPGFAVVRHVIFCGKDRGYEIAVHPGDAEPLLAPAPAPAALPPGEQTIAGAIVRASRVSAENVEVAFAAKPADEIRGELKQAGFRWSGRSACWYGPRAALPPRYAPPIADVCTAGGAS